MAIINGHSPRSPFLASIHSVNIMREKYKEGVGACDLTIIFNVM